MNIKYATSEMGFEGYFPVNYPNLRVLETQLLYLESYHLPIHKILTEGKTYKKNLMKFTFTKTEKLDGGIK